MGFFDYNNYLYYKQTSQEMYLNMASELETALSLIVVIALMGYLFIKADKYKRMGLASVVGLFGFVVVFDRMFYPTTIPDVASMLIALPVVFFNYKSKESELKKEIPIEYTDDLKGNLCRFMNTPTYTVCSNLVFVLLGFLFIFGNGEYQDNHTLAISIVVYLAVSMLVGTTLKSWRLKNCVKCQDKNK
jgi:hypothetical protein